VKSFDKELRSLKDRGLLRNPVCIDSSQGARISINGRHFINFSSNDYLNLSGHGDIVKAAMDALKKYGFGSGASRLLSGTLKPHRKLEERIARFKKTESALVFNTGYAANTGTIPAIGGKEALIFSDELNHASIIDGIRLSAAETIIYKHRDMNHLEGFLKKKRAKKNKIVITDTVFSMDGDIARLKETDYLCKKYRALLMIDDAHGTGVLGKTGRGGLEHFNVRGNNIIQMGTLSKAAGTFGAFVAGPEKLIKLLTSSVRSFIYSTSLPPSVAAAGIKAISIIETKSSGLRKRLWKNRERLFQGLVDMGFDTLESESPIIPVMAGDVKSALKLGNHLFKHGIYAPAIRPPTVHERECRIRFSVTAGHTDEDIERVIEALSRLK
jgi:8-amino-7-oxononanoate synthase